MKVYKFGGASVKDVKSIENLVSVLKKINIENAVIVVSAMGKMTNAFEEIIDSYFNDKNTLPKNINFAKKFHTEILNQLFKDKNTSIYSEVDLIFMQIVGFFAKNKIDNYNYVYDQVVSKAELLSTKILSAFLKQNNIKHKWIDARDYIVTDSNFRQAKVDFDKSSVKINKLKRKKLYLTQGFVAGTKNNKTTTLGREGSDYSAAIFAYALNANSVTIFKDVNGVLNADPKRVANTVLIKQMSYKEAIEMAFYGASIIHPKTIQPLQSKNIPLYVKSFKNPLQKGTTIKNNIKIKPKVPCFIVKDNQNLISITAKDFSFINEKNVSEIFNLLSRHQLKVNLIQNTAISFSLCLEDSNNNFKHFLDDLSLNYKFKYNASVKLLTIRHFNLKTIKQVEEVNNVLVKQTTRETVQFIVK
jgi:aspartate kinase